MEKLEMIEKLRERAQVTYDEAREALEQADGDLLDALIILERQGKVAPPKGGGYYSSEGSTAGEQQSQENRQEEQSSEKGGTQQSNSVKETLEKFGNFLLGLLRRGNSTSFEILKDKEHVASFPVTVLAIMLLFAPWVTLPLIVIGLFFGYHYQFVRNDN
ncbi:MAG TPA: DUF4342 domain-containing protein [Firmicutes bacterium]|jgi:hypothetical protein|nr:DUF4342 domain-containing protein [Bacillota bacterium]HHT42293.1 DUF4342 domain-containing protein [Bacillota bacterium]